MDLSNLRPPKGAKHSKKRVGRGQGSGQGAQAGRGHKGAQSRSGYKRKVGFEGGQMPLKRRVPKRGFHNPFSIEYSVVNLDSIAERFDADPHHLAGGTERGGGQKDRPYHALAVLHGAESCALARERSEPSS